MRTTHTLVQVAMALLDGSEARHWGYEMSKASGVRSGAIYPILARMIDQGWIVSGREDLAESSLHGRPPRRYFEVTKQGEREMTALLTAALEDARFFGFQDQLRETLSAIEVQTA